MRNIISIHFLFNKCFIIVFVIKKNPIGKRLVYKCVIKRNSVIDWDISLGEGKTFLPGYSYNIYIIVYGAQTIQVMAELTGWNDGGEVKIDPEEF